MDCRGDGCGITASKMFKSGMQDVVVVSVVFFNYRGSLYICLTVMFLITGTNSFFALTPDSIVLINRKKFF